MKLLLKRDKFHEHDTLGHLDVNGELFCYTLEDKDRALEKYPDKKVQNETCIPRGTYKVVMSMSNRFKKVMPEVLNVPGFAGVRIHSGNTNHDTEGCILVGEKWQESNGESFLPNSTVTKQKLYDIMQKAFDAKEEITLEIV